MGEKVQKRDVKKVAAVKPTATPMSSMTVGKTSKNQRVGVKQEQHEFTCALGHKTINVLMVGQGFKRLCECDGYAPINTALPYKQLKSSVVPGKKSDGVKSRGSYPAGLV